jgi:hypothetical protein
MHRVDDEVEQPILRKLPLQKLQVRQWQQLDAGDCDITLGGCARQNGLQAAVDSEVPSCTDVFAARSGGKPHFAERAV